MAERQDSRAATFDEFFDSEYRRLQAVAFALTGRRALAEELAQEAMIVVYKRWDTLTAYDDPAAFARRVVANKAISTYRRLAAEARAMSRIRGQAVSKQDEISPSDEALWETVRSLPDRQRLVVTLRYVADLDTAAIAAVVGCADSTVRVLLHRARKQLASELGRSFSEDP